MNEWKMKCVGLQWTLELANALYMPKLDQHKLLALFFVFSYRSKQVKSIWL